MVKVTVQFEVEVPESATMSEIEDWVAFEIGAKAQLSGSNPMSNMDLEAVRDSVIVR